MNLTRLHNTDGHAEAKGIRNKLLNSTLTMVGRVILLLSLAGCSAAPVRRAALPTWIEAAHFIPASEAIPPLPVPAGWQQWPCAVRHTSLAPVGFTNEAGALISWHGMIEFEPSPTAAVYRIEYLASEFGPRFYALRDIEHDGFRAPSFVEIIWTQVYAPEFRLLKKNLP